MEKAVYECMHNKAWEDFTKTAEYEAFITAGGITLPALRPEYDLTESEPASPELSLTALPLARAEKAP